MKTLLLTVAVVGIAGCAQLSLDGAEMSAAEQTNIASTTPTRERAPIVGAAPPASLHDAAEFARRLSNEYTEAASMLATAQDATHALVLLSASAYAIQNAAGASTRELTEYVVAGVGLERTITRNASRDIIRAIYSGARRMECIAIVAELGADLDGLQDSELPGAALSAVNSAINHSHILTRSAVVQDAPDFSAILQDLRADREDKGNEEPDRTSAARAYQTNFISFATMLNTCFGASDNPIPIPVVQ